jgi:hypothetical protein
MMSAQEKSEILLPPGFSKGPATDRNDEPVIDPTRNVLDLVDAAVTRLNDLNNLDRHWRDKLDAIREEHNRQIRKAESDRIDAIRAVDVGNVQRAAEVQATQALALANQVVATATALETKLGATVAPLQTRIDDLTRVQYEGVGGKLQSVENRASDADFAPLIAAVAALERTRAIAEGQVVQVEQTQKKGTSTAVWVAIGVSIFAFGFTAFLTIVGLILLYVSKK